MWGGHVYNKIHDQLTFELKSRTENLSSVYYF